MANNLDPSALEQPDNNRGHALPANPGPGRDRNLAIPEGPLREVELTDDSLPEDPCPEWAIFLASEAYAAL